MKKSFCMFVAFFLNSGAAAERVIEVLEQGPSWDEWKLKYDKQYLDDDDEVEHMRHWLNSKEYIDTRREEVDFEMELNKFAADGVAALHRKNKVLAKRKCKVDYPTRNGMIYDKYVSVIDMMLPKALDYRQQNMVTEVKDQETCGSCWTFSATGSIEGQYAKQYGKLVEFSESQILDCDVNSMDEGCNGGSPDGAFKFLIGSSVPLDTEDVYPYVDEQEACKAYTRPKNATTVYVKDYKDVPYTLNGGEKHLKHTVATVGPVSVAIDASHMDFQLYKSGVYSNEECSSSQLDHAVLVVGYGETENKKYWIVKNSWGKDWGMNGYIYMSRDNDNNCGIASQASYPILY